MGIENIKKKTFPVFKQYGVLKASVFGSAARGEEKEGSDVDVLVELKRPYGLAQFVALKRSLEQALSKTVDVVEYGAVKPAFSKNIFKDEKVIYEQR